MSCFHCALKQGSDCAALTILHKNTFRGIRLENYTSSGLLAEAISHAHACASAYTLGALKHQTHSVERMSEVSVAQGFAIGVFGDPCAY